MKTEAKHTPMKLQDNAGSGFGDYHFICIGRRLGTFNGHRDVADQLIRAVNNHERARKLLIEILEANQVSKEMARKMANWLKDTKH